MRRGFVVGAAVTSVIALAPASGHGSDVAAAAVGEASTGRPEPVLVHGDSFAPDADRQLAQARMRSLTPADRSLSERRLAGAWCGTERATNDTEHAAQADGHVIKVVYAYPSDYPDRFGTYADMIQSDVSIASQTIQSAAAGTRAPRFDLGTSCGPDYVDIASVRLGPRDTYIHGDGGAPLSLAERSARIAGDVNAALGSPGAPADLLVYGDGLYAGDEIGGLGQRLDDDRPGSDNTHNAGGLSAIILGSSTPGAASPNFSPAASRVSSVLHELGHALGAVQLSAPHSTGAGHCTDGADVLCYADGGPRGRPQDITARCANSEPQPFDCGADDYFSPSPAPGSYLATHWNLYNSAFLCVPSSCATGGAHAPQASFELRDSAGNAVDHTEAGSPVVLDGSASSDPDGSVASWSWDIGADGSVEATGPRFATSFPGPGAIPVRLRVTDAAGHPDAVTRTFTVNPAAIASPAPVAAAAPPASVSDGDSIDLEESSGSILRRRLRQARTSSEKRLRRLGGVKAMLRGKVLAIHFRAPQSGDLTAMLRLKDLPVAVKTGYAPEGQVSAIHLRLKAGARRVLRRQRKPTLKLVLGFAPRQGAGAGRRPR